MLYKCFFVFWDFDPALGYHRVTRDATSNEQWMDASWLPFAQQTRYIHPMMFQCWATVFDAGPTLKQLWVDASCITRICCMSGLPYPEMPLPAKTWHSNNVGLMLSHRLRCCPNIKPTLSADLRGVPDFITSEKLNTTLVQCRTNLTSIRPALSQRWVDALGHLPETDHQL